MPSVTRRTRSSRDRRREELRDRLLAVVEKILAEGGSYAELSVERLVTESEISRSTFYVYFEDKGDLLRAWFDQIVHELDPAAAQWFGLDGSASYDELRAALAHLLSVYRPHTALMATVFDTAPYDVTVREMVEAMMARNTAGLRGHIKRGQREGWIVGELLPNETAAWLMWMLERGQHQMVRGANDAGFESLVDSVTDVVWNTLYSAAPSRA